MTEGESTVRNLPCAGRDRGPGRRRLRRQHGGDYGGQHPDYAKALAGSPAPLAALHKQADRLLPGGSEAFDKRIAALRGYPAVVNVWASWCGPCRFEFPTLQKLSAAYGKRVAFLGVDSQDSDDAAEDLPRRGARSPIRATPTPTRRSPSELGATRGLPDTAFYDRQGKLVYLKQGPYTDHAELRADIERYALGEGPAPKADNRAMDAAVVVALVGIALLVGELLLSTGGVLAALGALGLIAGGVLALDSDSERRRLRRPGPDRARRALPRRLLLHHPQGDRGPRGARAHRRRGAGRRRRRGAQHARPRGPGLDRGGALERPPRPTALAGSSLGDRVRVEAVEGLTLVVRAEPPAGQAEEGAS